MDEKISIVSQLMETEKIYSYIIELIKSNGLMTVVLIILLDLLRNHFAFLKRIFGWLYNRPLINKLQKFDGIAIMNISKFEKNYVRIKRYCHENNIRFIVISPMKLPCRVFKRLKWCYLSELLNGKFGVFNDDGTITNEKLEKMFKHHKVKINVIACKLIKYQSLHYSGFPHVPLGFFDGYVLRTVHNIRFWNYYESSEYVENGFWELKSVLNSTVNIRKSDISNLYNTEEIILKIEQSFVISDYSLSQISSDLPILKFSTENIRPWSIINYAQVDSIKSQFRNYLLELSKTGVKKIHIVATTPTPLSFALGSAIEHHFPQVIVYNYNNGRFDWGIEIQKKRVFYNNKE